MAQNSKKDQIATAALPLFLDHGFKGTSIDLVVKTSGVSKPTVYNHYPDKEALLTHVFHLWLQGIQKPQLDSSFNSLETALAQVFDEEMCKVYRLMIGEGYKFAEVKQLFLLRVHHAWQEAVKQWALAQEQPTDLADHQFSTWLLEKLL